MKALIPFALTIMALLLVACGGQANASATAHAAGCAVEVFEEAPSGATENLGTVRARCSDDVSDTECLRQLQDAVCAMGGNVVWGVRMPPRIVDGRKQLSARAAKRK
jgi:hypothetical protein